LAFNNAGVEQPVKPAVDIPKEEWDRVLAVSGMFLPMQHQIRHMLRQGGGAVVNTSSGADAKGFKGQAAYSAAKHALVGLTRSAALDYGR
jgi:NAD(P)-dependent dehydrogenase (short-subunit alcohol dehydrogenase family)